jgi:hypothetical protein
VSSARTPTALESLARLRTMRALLAGEDRLRFERLVADVEQAVWEMESVTLDLAQLVAADVTASPDLQPIELTGVVSGALRNIDGALASRGVLIDIVAPPAVFVLGEPERLEQLLSVALVVSAAAVSPRGHAALRYGPRDGRVVDCSIAPYRARDPRAVIVDALARALGIRLSATDHSLSLAMQAPVDVASA